VYIGSWNVGGSIALILNEVNRRCWLKCGTLVKLICSVDAVTQRISASSEETLGRKREKILSLEVKEWLCEIVSL